MLTLLASVLTFVIAVPLCVFCAEVWAGLGATVEPDPGAPPRRTTVLMPAHDEAAGIARAIATVLAHGAAGLDVLVVADNCRDDTAAAARAAGARVVERHDQAHRGKGYALAFGRDALMADPPECVVVLDADCSMTGDDVLRLAAVAVDASAPVQCRNLQRPRADLPPTAALSNFAFLIKNLVRQRGMARIGHVAVLTGTGMAIPWTLIRDAPLATADLAEDLALGIWMTRQGHAPRFSAAATVWSDAVTGADLLAQRARWERGFLHVARRRALPLLAVGLGRGSRSLCWLGLHLMVPPLALLVAAALAVLVVTVGLAALGASWWAPAIVSALLIAAGTGVLLAWARHGRDQIDLATLARVPHYMLMKLPLYRRGSPAEWRRTRRAGEE